MMQLKNRWKREMGGEVEAGALVRVGGSHKAVERRSQRETEKSDFEHKVLVCNTRLTG